MPVENLKELCRGKTKTLFETEDPSVLLVEFRDDTTAFDGEKKEMLSDKGKLNNLLSEFIMCQLRDAGVPTHFIERVSDTQSKVKRLKMIPLESVVRNIAAGSLCRRIGVEEKKVLTPPTYELFLKDDALHDPMVNVSLAKTLGWANQEELDAMQSLSLKINDVLKEMFAKAGLILVDAKYEFGVCDGQVMLGDEISPDSCRIWDAETNNPLDKDRFRKDMGDVVESYQIIAQKLGI